MAISVPAASALRADDVDRLLDEGRTLPAELYTSESFYAQECELIFKRDWLFACTELDLAKPGDYMTTNVAGIPIVVLRNRSGEIKAFINVCRHRANVLVEGAGNCKNLRCGYHAWTYSLDGKLVGAPKFKEGNLPPFETLGLNEVSVDTYAGFVFISLEPQISLSEQLGDIPEILVDLGYEFPFVDGASDLRHMPAYDASDVVRCNWKVFVENGQECYHCQAVHPDSLSALCDFDLNFRITTRGRFNTFFTTHLPAQVMEKYGDQLTIGKDKHGLQTITFWPNVQILCGAYGQHVLRYEPLDASRIRYSSRSYAPAAMSDELFAELTEILVAQTGVEDVDIVESVQRGLESGYYRSGPLMENLEEMIHVFQQRVWDRMRPAYT